MKLGVTKASASSSYNGLGDQLYDLGGARPTLDLNFSSNGSLVDSVTGKTLVDHTRQSSATYVDGDGVIRTAVTNIIWPSEDFTTTWGVAAATRVADAGVAPNGTLTADRIESTGGGVFRSGISIASGVSYTYSIYIKHVSGTGVISTIGFERFGSVPLAGSTSFNVLTGTVVSDGASVTASSITPVGDGWFRVSVRATSTDTTTTIINYAAASGNQFLLWGAQLEQSSTVGQYVKTTTAINSAPRFDHDPTTGESLGLLVEEARTNSVRNNTMVGAVAGTPGTNPTNWGYVTTQSNGLTQSIIGTGTENGINYIDYRFNGTTVASPNAIAFGFEGTAGVAATGQTWTGSIYLRLANGTLTGVNNTQIGLIENTSGGSFVDGAFYTVSLPTSAALISQRRTATRTLSGGATVEICSLTMNINVAGSTDIDFTLRIGMPQLEQGAFATSVIPTSTATVTRAADVASITGTNFSSWYEQSEGTVFADFSTLGTRLQYPLSIDDGSTTNFIAFGVDSSNSRFGRIDTSGVTQAAIVSGSSVVGASNRAIIGYFANNIGSTYNGTTAGSDLSASIPTVNRMTIGSLAGSSTFATSSTIRRLTYWPTRLSNDTLQTITA